MATGIVGLSPVTGPKVTQSLDYPPGQAAPLPTPAPAAPPTPSLSTPSAGAIPLNQQAPMTTGGLDTAGPLASAPATPPPASATLQSAPSAGTGVAPVAPPPAVPSPAVATPGAPALSGSSTPAIRGVSLTGINPAADLRSQTITGDASIRPSERTQQYLDSFLKQQEPFWAKQDQEFSQRAAALGRTGMGDTSKDFENLTAQRSRDYNTMAAQLAMNASGLDQSQQNWDVNNLQGERDYESRTAQQALLNAIQQYQMGQGSLTSQLGNAEGVLAAGGAAPTGAQLGAANYFGNESAGASQSLADMMRYQAMLDAINKGYGGPSAATGATTPMPANTGGSAYVAPPSATPQVDTSTMDPHTLDVYYQMFPNARPVVNT